MMLLEQSKRGGWKMIEEHREQRTGFIVALTTFVAWGFLAMYWKFLQEVPPLQILAHRIVWSMLFLVLCLLVSRRLGEVWAALRQRATIVLLVFSSVAISVNWLTYIIGVNSDRLLEVSMGYYINPLVNVFFGFVIFHDRLRPVQWCAIALAAAGVGYRVATFGAVPWVAFILAGSFGTYGVLRKLARVAAIPGLSIETVILTVPAAGYLAWAHANGQGAMGGLGADIDLLLVGSALATALPLLGFTYGARRLSLVTLGLLQYLAPTIHFILGLWVFGEPFGTTQLVMFVCIWTALTVYTAEGILHRRRLALEGEAALVEEISKDGGA
ncbi:MAG: EamA family transporter RarD [Synergistales bacterium]|nr:EamA family transporter RarD [Synergistales bacterium]